MSLLITQIINFHVLFAGAKPEYEYIKSSFGFSEKAVVYTGLARFDELHDYKKQENLIITCLRGGVG